MERATTAGLSAASVTPAHDSRLKKLRWSVPGSRFKIKPDPPEAGQPAEVTYVGSADEVEYQIDGEDPIAVKPDRDGKFKIDPVPHGQSLALSDNLGQPGYLHRQIIVTRGGGK